MTICTQYDLTPILEPIMNPQDETVSRLSTKTTHPTPILSYTERDILSGRGGRTNKHTGNRVFRRLVQQNKKLYRELKSKRKQNLLIESILLAVESQESRFLKHDKDTNTWIELSAKERWEKTSQALREPDRKNSAASEVEPMVTTSAPPMPAPSAFHRQYTTDNPPAADPCIFDKIDIPTKEAAPALLRLSSGHSETPPTLLRLTSGQSGLWSLGGFPMFESSGSIAYANDFDAPSLSKQEPAIPGPLTLSQSTTSSFMRSLLDSKDCAL